MSQTLMHTAASPQTAPDPENWTLRSACRRPDLDQELWFQHNTMNKHARKARAICRMCPVAEACLREALTIPDTIGIWGGLDEYERERLRAGRTVIGAPHA